jgi:hypothetical protein
MRHSLSKTLLACALPFAFACTTSPTDPAKSPEGGAPAGDGARVAANSPIAGKDERFGQVRVFAGEDPGVAVAIPGKRAFTLGPGESWTIGLYDFVRSDGTKNVFKGPPGEQDFAIPGAYTRPASPQKGLAKGAPVLVPDEGATVCGRVVSSSDTELEVAVLDENSKLVKKTLPVDGAYPLDGKLDFGAPVAYKAMPDAKGYTQGLLVRIDAQYAWLQGASRVAPAQVKAIDVARTYKAGDKIFVVQNDGTGLFAPVTITKVVGDGLAYEFKNKDGAADIVDYCSATSAL